MNSDNSSRDLRSVWQRQDTSSPALPIDELRMASAKFSRKVFLRNIREYVAAVIVVAGYSCGSLTGFTRRVLLQR